MLNVDYMLDVAIQEIGNVNLLKKECVENIKDNTAYVYLNYPTRLTSDGDSTG